MESQPNLKGSSTWNKITLAQFGCGFNVEHPPTPIENHSVAAGNQARFPPQLSFPTVHSPGVSKDCNPFPIRCLTLIKSSQATTLSTTLPRSPQRKSQQ